VPPLRLLKVEPKMVIKISNLRWGQIQYSKNYFCIKANIMKSKLLLISNLLLGEKTVRPAEGGTPNSFGKMGGNQWDALRASHLLALKKPLSSVLVYLLYSARTYFQNR